MGAVISSWQPPENDEIPLTREDILQIVGEEYFDEEKFLELSQGNDE